MEILEYTSIDELNRIYDMIGELPDYIADSLEEFLSGYVTLEELVEHKDEVYFYPDCDDMTDVAHYFIDGAKRFLISAQARNRRILLIQNHN